MSRPWSVALAAVVVLSGAAVGGALSTAADETAGIEAQEKQEPSFRFVDIGEAAGLEAPTWCGRPEKPHIFESGGAGLAFFDYDGDGDLDLYVVDGWRLEGAVVVERGRNRLYRNDGKGRFEDVTESAGVGDDGWGTGVAVGDVDTDGHPDLFVSNFGRDVFYLNQGDGTFESLIDGPGIDGWSTGAVLFDADDDEDLDLYVGGYIDCTVEEVLHAEPELAWEGLRVMLGPFGLEGKANRFFENLGDASFRETTADAGLEDVGLFYTFAVLAADLDGDLDLDLYAANDSNPNYLYENSAGGFSEVGLWSGAALDGMGNAQAGMGLAAQDLDGDGLLDLLVTNFYKDVSTLYRNLGDFMFEDRTEGLGLKEVTYSPLSWGAQLEDFDHDGQVDLFIANGHIYPQADLAPAAGTTFRQKNLLLAGTDQGFSDRSSDAGPGFEVTESSRGVAVGDTDLDGDLDLAVWNMDAPPTLLRNDTTTAGSWLILDSPSALRVMVEARTRRQVRHRVIGGSYVSVSDQRFHFGLGRTDGVERVEILQQNGKKKLFLGLPASRVVRFLTTDF